jgi:hypothetical protein
MKKTIFFLSILLTFLMAHTQTVSTFDPSKYRTCLGLGTAATKDTTDFLTVLAANATFAKLVSPSFTTPALGTPSSGNLVNCTFPTLNQNTTGSAATLTTPRTINGVSFDGSANITVPSNITAGTSGQVMTSNGTLWTSAANNGGWTVNRVTGSDFTTTSTTLTDITGLVSVALTTATLYEFEATLYVNSSTTAGITIGIQQSGTGSGQIGVFTGTATNAAATGLAIGSNALNTASAACVLVAGDGTITIKGFIKTGSAGTPSISIKVAKVATGTAKVYIGSKLQYRIAQ